MKVYFATLRCGPSDVAFLKKKNRVESVRCCPFTLTHGERMNKSPILIFPYNFGFLDALKKERTLCFPLLDFSLSLPLSFEKRVKFKAKKKKIERGDMEAVERRGKRKKKKWERENENFTLQNVSQRRWEGTTWGWPVSYSKFNTRVHTHRHTTDRRFFFFFLEVAFSQEKSGQPKRMSTSFYFWKKRTEKKEINNKIKKKRNT